MVQTDILQLTRECNNWRESLHSHRDEFNQLKSNLNKIANQSLTKSQWVDVEHFQNILHIQLINIHDLKQAVKAHDRKVNFEMSAQNGQISDDTLANHDNLYDQYQSLEHALSEIRSECNHFINKF